MILINNRHSLMGGITAQHNPPLSVVANLLYLTKLPHFNKTSFFFLTKAGFY
jgi:hypothetical protein